jgi:hypothetical protein
MPKKATTTDAEIILKLYDLRRETEMRKARNWWGAEFWPQSADDLIRIATSFGSQENAWLRQVAGYWDMAASLVLHGALSEELFLEPGNSGELFYIFAKVEPYVKEFREKMQNPDAFVNIERLAMKTEQTRERLSRMKERIAAFQKRRAEVAKAS